MQIIVKKIQPLGHFFGFTLGNKLQFYTVWSKNQNKSRLSRNATKLYRHLCKNTCREFAKFHSIPNKHRFIDFSTKTRNITIDVLPGTEPKCSWEPAVVNCNRKDWTVVNYRWGQKRIFHVFLWSIGGQKSNFHTKWTSLF